MHEIIKSFYADGKLYIEVRDNNRKRTSLYEANEIKRIQDKELRLYLHAQMYWVKQGVFKQS